MEIRDVIHGFIHLERHELPILDSTLFQRLRHIKQTGFAEHSYPGLTHNRYIHSLGALQTATHLFNAIFPAPTSSQGNKKLSASAHARFLALTRLAALLHDVGHGPLSHTTEFAMPPVSELKIPGIKKNRKATHEDYTLKIILDSPLTPLLEKAGQAYGFKPIHIAAAIESHLEVPDDFFIEKIEGESINFRTLIHQLISSELDADRMDYLRRDSYCAGVSYGYFAHEWITANLSAYVKDHDVYLALRHRALYAFEDFLLSRYHMFLMVYLHHKTVVYDEMLGQYFKSPDCDYTIPSDIEAYIQCTDAQLVSHLTHSKNQWAKRIINKTPYRMLLETHSGIPNTEAAHDQQERLFKKLCQDLDQKGISYLTSLSTGILSKYFGKADAPLYILYDNLYSAPTFIPLPKCTPLFTQYPAMRSISRIFVPPEDFSNLKSKGRDSALIFD